MQSPRNSDAIRIGIVAGEPLRLVGLRLVFEEEPTPDRPRLLPVIGRLEELLADKSLEYLVVDINISSGGFETLEIVRRARPTIRQIVIGPKGEDEVVLNSIIAGARAYLDSSAGPETVRMAIEVVVSGSIWAPRRLLSKLIDRLLGVAETAPPPRLSQNLTERERQVLELILRAKPNREIAAQLGIEERTVKAYVARLMRKTGAENRIELSMRALNGALLSAAPASEAAEALGEQAGGVMVTQETVE